MQEIAPTSSAAEIMKTLVEQTQSQLNKEPTETDIMTLAFTLVPKIQQLAKGQLKGSEKMEILLETLDVLLNMCNQEFAGPIRASLRDRIFPAVSGLINATHTGDVSLGIASAVAVTTQVIAVPSKGCWCLGKYKGSAIRTIPAPAAAELPPLPPSPSTTTATATDSTIEV